MTPIRSFQGKVSDVDGGVCEGYVTIWPDWVHVLINPAGPIERWLPRERVYSASSADR